MFPRLGSSKLISTWILGGTAVATTLLALITAEVWHRRYFGGWAACDVLVICTAIAIATSFLWLFPAFGGIGLLVRGFRSAPTLASS